MWNAKTTFVSLWKRVEPLKFAREGNKCCWFSLSPPTLTPAYTPAWQTFAQHELAEAVARESDLELQTQAQQVGQSFLCKSY